MYRREAQARQRAASGDVLDAARREKRSHMFITKKSLSRRTFRLPWGSPRLEIPTAAGHIAPWDA